METIKLDEIVSDILPDTYVLYSTGGYHPFYGVSGTEPIYQEPIWPCVRRINWKNKTKKNNGSLRNNHHSTQINPTFTPSGYPEIAVERNRKAIRNDWTKINKKGEHYVSSRSVRQTLRLHRIVCLAWIPNPANKPFVMHLDNDPTNYLMKNLKWGSPRDNMVGKIKRCPQTLEEKYNAYKAKGWCKGIRVL